MIKILVVDDDAYIRRLVSTILNWRQILSDIANIFDPLVIEPIAEIGRIEFPSRVPGNSILYFIIQMQFYF